jgi:hypothetical protein
MSEHVDEVLPPQNTKRRHSDKPKTSVALKRAWHAACFHPRDRKGSGRHWRRLGGQWMPLKLFAKDAELGKAWVANKHGASNQKKQSA